jgi:hypothetical protein
MYCDAKRHPACDDSTGSVAVKMTALNQTLCAAPSLAPVEKTSTTVHFSVSMPHLCHVLVEHCHCVLQLIQWHTRGACTVSSGTATYITPAVSHRTVTGSCYIQLCIGWYALTASSKLRPAAGRQTLHVMNT